MMMAHYIYGTLLAIGLILATLALKFYRETKTLLANGYITKATVTSEKKEYENRSPTYRPIFSFTDYKGKKLYIESEVSTRPRVYEIGDTVNIVYDPNNEGKGKVVSFWGLYRMAIIFLCIALPMLVISVSYYMYRYSWGGEY